MSNLRCCVWPGEEKELESQLPLGGQTQWKEILWLELPCVWIPSSLQVSPGKREWGEYPEASTREDDRLHHGALSVLWDLVPRLFPNFQKFDPRPSFS